jgi:L-alanine-DL-glutamate epimerase-like enolase superfamily enzyme
VDANQSWSRELLESLLPALQALGVELVEQPVRRGDDTTLAGLVSPIPLAADESCVDHHSIERLAPFYQVMSIKLDKCGGLTEALAMADEATVRGLGLMVGNMCGTSLGMAPAMLIGQRCQMVDLDGPLLQVGDRAHPLRYEDGRVYPPPSELWG